MRASYRVWVIGAVGVGTVLGGYYFYWLRQPVHPWTTSSPMTQNGIRLIAIQPKPPREIGKSHVGWEEPTQLAWLEVMDASLTIPDDRRSCQNFALVGKNGERAYFDGWDFSDASPDHKKYIEVAIPLDYSPNYQNGTLIAIVDGKTIAEWKLQRMPKPERQIPTDEPAVTDADAMGYKVKLHSPATSLAEMIHDPQNRLADWRFDVDVLPTTEETKKTTDKLSYEIDIPRTTWRKYAAPRMMATCCSQNHLTIGRGEGFADDVEAVEVFITLKRQRSYDEPITLKNVWIDPSSRFVYTDLPQYVETPSGIKFTVVNKVQYTGEYPLSMKLSLNMVGEYRDVRLQSSPLYQETKKPAQITLANPHFNQGTAGMTKSEDPKIVSAYFGYVPIKTQHPYRIPKLDLMVRQTTLIEKKTVRLLVPIVRNQAKL